MADNLVGGLVETNLWFLPATATQAEDAAFEIQSLASGAGRQSAQYDLGVARAARRFVWRACAQFATAPVLNERIDVYLKTSDGNHPDNDDGTTEGAVSAEDKLKGLHHIGSIIVDEAAINIEMVGSGEVIIRARYVQVVWWNTSADALTSDVNENGFILTGAPDEIE